VHHGWAALDCRAGDGPEAGSLDSGGCPGSSGNDTDALALTARQRVAAGGVDRAGGAFAAARAVISGSLAGQAGGPGNGTGGLGQDIKLPARNY